MEMYAWNLDKILVLEIQIFKSHVIKAGLVYDIKGDNGGPQRERVE